MGPRGMELALRREQMEREPNWKEIITNYWPQYLVVALIGVAVDYVDGIEPYQWAIYTGSDAEYYRYSYAHMHETVPDWMVPVVALGIPIGIFLLSYLTGRTSRVELHHACLMLVACVLTTGMLTNAIKVQVGRPRPDFMSRCWPSGGPPMVTRKGLPKCEPGVDHAELVKGQRSFPSGHTSWSAAGLGYLTFWLMGTLRCFCGNAEPARLFFSLMPQMGVVWMGMNRVRHHKHHAEDVLASFVLGTFLAWAFYRKVFASVRSINAGRLSADATRTRIPRTTRRRSAACGAGCRRTGSACTSWRWRSASSRKRLRRSSTRSPRPAGCSSSSKRAPWPPTRCTTRQRQRGRRRLSARLCLPPARRRPSTSALGSS